MRDHLQRLRTLFVPALCTLVLAGCATFAGYRWITYSEADMVRFMEEHGPFHRRLIEVLDVRITHPTVHLAPLGNHLASDFEIYTTDRGSGKTYPGRISIDYKLRYDDGLKALRVTQVKVTRLQIENLPSPDETGLARLGTLIAEQMLDDAVIYHFKPGDLRNAQGRPVRPSTIKVTARGVEVALAPVTANR